jgi:2-haloacid dehalogenase
MKSPKLILFDVYETMMDMGNVERRINALTDSIRGYTIWLEIFMEYCFVDNCTVQFNDYNSIARAALTMTGKKLDRKISNDDADHVLEILKQLPVKEGVQEGLSLLRDQDFRIAALTNASEKGVCERMERTGLISYFEAVLSAEAVRKYKPCNEVYEWAAKKLNVDKQDVMMVTAHGWDVAGAANVGMQTAYLKQSREMLYPLAPKPQLIVKDLVDLAQQLEKNKGTD